MLLLVKHNKNGTRLPRRALCPAWENGLKSARRIKSKMWLRLAFPPPELHWVEWVQDSPESLRPELPLVYLLDSQALSLSALLSWQALQHTVASAQQNTAAVFAQYLRNGCHTHSSSPRRFNTASHHRDKRYRCHSISHQK